MKMWIYSVVALLSSILLASTFSSLHEIERIAEMYNRFLTTRNRNILNRCSLELERLHREDPCATYDRVLRSAAFQRLSEYRSDIERLVELYITKEKARGIDEDGFIKVEKEFKSSHGKLATLTKTWDELLPIIEDTAAFDERFLD